MSELQAWDSLPAAWRIPYNNVPNSAALGEGWTWPTERYHRVLHVRHPILQGHVRVFVLRPLEMEIGRRRPRRGERLSVVISLMTGEDVI